MQVVTIGRGSGNDIVINDPYVGKNHCQIEQFDNGKFEITDLQSTNGTFVNGWRINGKAPLRPYDVVKIGQTTLPWMDYFTNIVIPAPTPKPPKRPKRNKRKAGFLWPFLLVLLIVTLVVVVFLMNQKDEKKHRRGIIDGVFVKLNMTIEEIQDENEGVEIVKYTVPSNDDDDPYGVTVVYTGGFSYYTINSNIAVTLDKTDETVNYICTQSPDYKTPKGIYVGCTWGELEKAYPYLEYTLTFYYFNYFANKYETAIEVDDPETCTKFTFFESQFSSVQWESIMSATAATDCWSGINVSAISSYVMETIRSSVTIAQISFWECEKKEKPAKTQTYNNSGSGNSSNYSAGYNQSSTSTYGMTAEMAARRLMYAIIIRDISTVRELTTDELYDEFLEEMQYVDQGYMDENKKQKIKKAIFKSPVETFKTGENVVVVRFKNDGMKFDFYMKNENGWKGFDYAQNGVHVPRSVREQMRENSKYY